MREEIADIIRKALSTIPREDETSRWATAFSAAINITNNLFGRAHEQIPPKGDFACKRGCCHCCLVVAPVVTKAEIHCMLQMLKGPLQNHDGCPFLDDKACSIYPYRPIMCRGVNSYDKEFCENPPLLFEIGPDGDAPVYYPRVHIARQVHMGLCDALEQKPKQLKEALKEINHGGKHIN